MKYLEVKRIWNPITDTVEQRPKQESKTYHAVETTSIPRRKPRGY